MPLRSEVEIVTLFANVAELDSAIKILTDCRQKLDPGPDRDDVWLLLFNATLYLMKEWKELENAAVLHNGKR